MEDVKNDSSSIGNQYKIMVVTIVVIVCIAAFAYCLYHHYSGSANRVNPANNDLQDVSKLDVEMNEGRRDFIVNHDSLSFSSSSVQTPSENLSPEAIRTRFGIPPSF